MWVAPNDDAAMLSRQLTQIVTQSLRFLFVLHEFLEVFNDTWFVVSLKRLSFFCDKSEPINSAKSWVGGYKVNPATNLYLVLCYDAENAKRK